MNASYVHSLGKAYEAIASEIKAKFGKRKRFDLETETVFEDNQSLSDYLRDDYKAESENAIKMYMKALEINENFQ